MLLLQTSYHENTPSPSSPVHPAVDAEGQRPRSRNAWYDPVVNENACWRCMSESIARSSAVSGVESARRVSGLIVEI
jgi:hypothetical protein